MIRAEGLAKAAIRKLLSDEAAARRLGHALAVVQRGQERLDRARDEVLRTLGIAGRDEWRRLSRRLARTKHRLRDLEGRLARREAARREDRSVRPTAEPRRIREGGGAENSLSAVDR